MPEQYGLNSEQFEAITAKSPTIVNASAGSGKTRILVTKIRYLLDSGVQPRNILSVTFTNKAANEMKNRIKLFCPYVADMQVSTIHSMSVRIIKTFPQYTPLKVPFSIYDDSEQLSIIKTIAKARGIVEDPSEILSLISKAKSEDTIDKDFEEIQKVYQEILIKNNAADFDDLLLYSRDCLKHEDCKTHYSNLWQHILVDECHGYKTHVMVDYNKSVPIGDVYYDDQITHVLSYNLKQRQIEKKKILKKIEKSFYGKKCDLWIKNSQGNKIYLKPTRNHEYYVVGKGYIRADNLEPGDKLIEYTGEFKSQYATRCKYPNCKKIVYSDLDKHPYMTAHYRKKHGHKIKIHACPVCKEEIKGSIKWHNFWHHGNKIEQIELIEKRDESHKKYFKTQKGILDRKNLSKRMITNNPDHNKKYKEKAAISWKKTFYSKSVEEQLKIIKRFQLAPTHKKKPNNVEKSIIDMGISNLKFTGDGKYYVTLQIEGKKFHKNPDFIYVPEKCGVCKNFDLCNGIQKNNNSCEKWEISPSFRTNKVVEIMDFEYWHTKKEAEEIKKAYQEHGIKCLIIDATFPPYKKRSEIEAFINNHYATVISSKICKKKDHKNNKVYTLKVEDNHNYFVLATNSKHQFGDKNIPITPILVSNCQDLSKIQYEIVTLINDPQKTKTLFLVGDINQSIFGWRSAKPENMDDFIEKYKPSVQFLTFNYRSSPEIVSHANQYLQFGKPMVSKIAYKGIVSMTQFSSQEEEASKISEALQRIGNYPESVIIYRANSRSILFEKALAMRRIPYKVVGDIPFYKRRVSKDLLSYCKAAVNRQDMESLIRSVNTPKRGFGEAKQERLLNNGWSYLQAMAEAMPPIQAFIELLESIKRKRPLQAVEEVIFKTGYRDTLKTDGDKQMLTSFLNITTGFNSIEELVLTSSFLEEDSGHGVKLMTAHASKGLEFDNVFVVGVEKDLWPHILSEDVDEERRLYYVAITRSKRFLNISYSKTKLYRNIQIPVLPSPLFEESLKSMAKNNV